MKKTNKRPKKIAELTSLSFFFLSYKNHIEKNIPT